MARAQWTPSYSFQFLQRVAHLPLGEQGVLEADPDQAVHIWIVVTVEQLAAGFS